MENKEYKYVKFLPWVGEYYKEGVGFLGKKILVLGDSHYCENECSENGRCYPKCEYEKMRIGVCDRMTNDLMIDEYFHSRKQGGAMARHLHTILNFEKNIFNYTPTLEESTNFWNSVIFYNYKQHSQPKPGEERNTSYEEKQEYRMAFEEILQEYKPKYIVVWSKTLFTKDWLPDGAKDVPDYTLTVEKDGNIYDAPVRTFITSDGTEIPAIITQHPCCRYGKGKYQPKWHALLKKFLELDD